MQSNFNPRSPWGERHAPAQHTLFIWQISIHALREESDCLRPPSLAISPKFQSTLSVRRATGLCLPTGLPITIFQSTLSVRRATKAFSGNSYKNKNFNPRSPWGERQVFNGFNSFRPGDFNPRSPWGERHKNETLALSKFPFQSTLSVRRATGGLACDYKGGIISIHALREESDVSA